MGTVKEMLGKKQGRLTVLEFVAIDRNNSVWRCLCECGKECKVTGARLRSGHTRSCGCLETDVNREKGKTWTLTHGMTDTLTGNSWMAMMGRCFNPRHSSFKRYGQAGIVPCEFIKSSPLNLVILIGERPKPELTLDRIKNEFGYHCGACAECLVKGWKLNVRWATHQQQRENSSSIARYNIDGKIKTRMELVRELGISYDMARDRFKHLRIKEGV